MPRRTKLQRRGFLGAGLAAAGAVGLSGATAAAAFDTPGDGATFLFQGDSITDVGRDRRRNGANHPRGLGGGYPMLIASQLLSAHPKSQWKVFNRGISGNKVPDLDKRWQEDCIDIKPDVLSILIGVNDIWHKLNGRYEGTVASYRDGLAALLERTQKALPETRLVICQPFVLRCGAVSDKWFPEFDQRREACKRVADKAGCAWVPFQEMFDKACEQAPPEYWAADGVHPTIAGHGLMAATWIDTVL